MATTQLSSSDPSLRQMGRDRPSNRTKVKPNTTTRDTQHSSRTIQRYNYIDLMATCDQREADPVFHWDSTDSPNTCSGTCSVWSSRKTVPIKVSHSKTVLQWSPASSAPQTNSKGQRSTSTSSKTSQSARVRNTLIHSSLTIDQPSCNIKICSHYQKWWPSSLLEGLDKHHLSGWALDIVVLWKLLRYRGKHK